ncbi:MAG: GAF domain-containing protein [Bacteroidetes bacterium]|nr:GAF domain-containing protein [Bacteroidota bacterium]
MYKTEKIQTNISKSNAYNLLSRQALALFENERDFIANAANLSALLFQSLADVNWVGFYILKANELVLGPFQGKVACARLPLGKGVCGTSAIERKTIVVDNVHEFEGHIACDSSSNSEIVIPLIVNSQVIGVLDIDSPTFNRFDSDDQCGLKEITGIFLSSSDY